MIQNGEGEPMVLPLQTSPFPLLIMNGRQDHSSQHTFVSKKNKTMNPG